MSKGLKSLRLVLLVTCAVMLTGFVSALSQLSVNWQNTAYGTVNTTILGGTVVGGATSCGPTSCTVYYLFNTTGSARLQAIAYSNGVFVGWSGSCSGTNSLCILNISGNVNVSATFILGNATNQTQTHLECRDSMCSLVNGSGINQCSTIGIVCGNATNQTHLECRNNMCTVVAGSGVSQCLTSGAVCANTTGSHLECRNMACVNVSGYGNNTCTTGAQCAHLACISNTCTLTPGIGLNECAKNGTRCYNVTKENITGSPKKIRLSPSCGFFRRLFGMC